MEGLYVLTQEKENSLSHREAMLKENERIFAEQWKITCGIIQQKLDLQRQDEKRMRGLWNER